MDDIALNSQVRLKTNDNKVSNYFSFVIHQEAIIATADSNSVVGNIPKLLLPGSRWFHRLGMWREHTISQGLYDCKRFFRIGRASNWRSQANSIRARRINSNCGCWSHQAKRGQGCEKRKTGGTKDRRRRNRGGTNYFQCSFEDITLSLEWQIDRCFRGGTNDPVATLKWCRKIDWLQFSQQIFSFPLLS